MKTTLLNSALLALLLTALPASAGVNDDARALMASEQYAEALKKLDEHLGTNPQDAEARFTRGLALVKLNRNDEAVKAFAALTRDYPQLPEPYNNLAVLYAQMGDYDKAREALEAALATHPSYPTAHENLGDIYAALAAAAYNRALMLDQNNPGLRSKLNLVSQLDQPATTAVAAATPVTAKPAAAPKPAIVAAVKPAVTPPTKPLADSTTATEGITRMLDGWTQAWSAKDMDKYFAAYDASFRPEGGVSREVWESQRAQRIAKPKSINVKAADTEIAVTGKDTARLSFKQEYQSDSYSDEVTKVLEVKLDGGAWKIEREYTR